LTGYAWGSRPCLRARSLSAMKQVDAQRTIFVLFWRAVTVSVSGARAAPVPTPSTPGARAVPDSVRPEGRDRRGYRQILPGARHQ
jgi:hypothetical protein